ncbi:MAG: SusC/RagA family TonB-linked outer membrane protein [Bacteroidales bacterium]|jgi:TonB-linked SusC/RagA family outer membrane protein|nr:SusC/RagA family TonB-linked outer membrane protein [Bacteroidales bacterium]
MRKLNVFKKRLLLLLSASFFIGYVHAQIVVSGTLVGPDGKGLIGASVIEKGTNNGVQIWTEDGAWQLSVKSPESVLTFELTNFVTQTKTVGATRNFGVVKLQPAAATELAGVVKIGYASARPEDVTGGITQLSGSTVSRAPVLAVDQALQGKAAGVQVRANSGRPGGGMDIVVRGRGTAGDARPLYVVDGVPVGNEWRGDPSNIESISILKDASSTAIYGARGANGVVLITTRGGNAVSGADSDYINVSFDAYIGGQEAWKKLDVMSGDEYRKAQEQLAGTTLDWTGFEENTNWQDQIFQKGLIDKFKITLEGGSPRTSWSASAGSTKQEGIVKGSGYQRYDAGYKGMWQLNNYIDLGANIGFNQNTMDVLAAGNDLRNTVLGNALIAPPITAPFKDGQLAGTYKYKNPLGLVLKNDAGSQNYTRNGYGLGTGAWVNIKIPHVEGLEFRSQASYGRWENNDEVYVPEFMISRINNQFNDISFLQNTINGGYNWTVSNTLSYTLNLKDKADSTRVKHAIRLLAGHEALYEYQDGYRIKMSNVPEAENMRYPSMGSLMLPDGHGGKKADENAYTVPSWLLPTEHAMLSYIGRAEYGFKDKYLVNGTIRRDGSSRFGGANKFGIFPSVGVAWKVNKEPFFYNNEWLRENVTMFKFRGGWGKIGNESIGNYLFLSQYGTSGAVPNRYSFGGSVVDGAAALSTINPDIKWEEATSWNIGSDLSLFKNKIVFNYDFFIKHNYDNLIQISVPAVAGVDNVSASWPTVNAGTIRNYGSEFSLTYQDQWLPSETAKFPLTYSVNGNFTIINNEVTGMEGGELYGGRVNPPDVLLTTTREGYPIAAFFGYKVDGVFSSWEEVNKGAQTDAKPGDFRLVDIDGDGRITENDKTYIGNPHPKFSYGLNFDAGYAGFDLGLAFQGVQGNDIFNATKWYLDGGFELSNMSTRRLDAWSETNRGSSEPTDASWFTNTAYFPNSAFIEKGSFMRLKNITLGYTLPARITERVHIQKFRVYVQAQNLLTFTKYSGFDPEIGSNEDTNWEGPEFGIDRGVYPQARTFVYGVNITF